LVVELSALYGVFAGQKKRTIWNLNFSKATVVKKKDKYPWL